MKLHLIGLFFTSICLIPLSGCDWAPPQPEPTPTRLSIPVTSTPSQSVSPIASEEHVTPDIGSAKLATFYGASQREQTYEYAIDFNPTRWMIDEYLPDSHPIYGKRLQHRLDVDCFIRLYGGPMGLSLTERREIAGRKWSLSALDVIINRAEGYVPAVVYMTSAKAPTTATYFLAVILPAPYEPPVKGRCHQQAEEVIATFRITDKIRGN